jgi:hypothetical protein
MQSASVFAIYQNWTDTERTEIERLRNVFPEPRFELECQCSDCDEPWCLVHDLTFDRVLLHLARIGPCYVLAPEGKRALHFSTIAAAVDMAMSMAPLPDSAREVA